MLDGALEHINEAAFDAHDMALFERSELLLLTWLGYATNQAVACLMQRRGFTASPAGPGVEVLKGDHSTDDIFDALIDAGMDEPPSLDDLLADVKNLQREKGDWALPDQLLRRSYASLHLDVGEALAWARSLDRYRRC